MLLSIRYPTTLATGRRKGKMMPLVAPGTLPPQNTASKAPLRQRLSIENFSIIGRVSQKVIGK